MKRAAELFVMEEWGSVSAHVDKSWTTRSEPEPAFISVASSNWLMCVTTRRDRTQLTVRGPFSMATVTPIPADAEFLGIVFSLGTFMPAFPPVDLVDGAIDLPPAAGRSAWLDGDRWEIPTPANADVFVNRLVRSGLLVHDPQVADALRGEEAGVSTRTLQRRVRRATGLTRRTIRQIARAGRAVNALEGGMSSHDVALRLGYADEPHLIRSLRRFVGQTPAEVARSGDG